MKKSILICMMMLTAVAASAKVVPGIHSHNDYNRTFPFFDAYKAHALSIEADIFLVDGEFYVSHDEKDILPWRTLKTMYLEPIKKLFHAFGGHGYADGSTYYLTVDLKDGDATLDALEKVIAAGYEECFDVEHNPGAITIAISGDVVQPKDFTRHPNFIYQDGRIGVDYTPEQLARVAMISSAFDDYVKWDGVRDLTAEEINLLKGLVNEVHSKGKPIRFWGIPDTEKAWQLTQDLGIDFVNTDSPEKVNAYFNKK